MNAGGLKVHVLGALLLSLLMVGVAPEAPVADAAQRGDLDGVRALLRDGADVNAAQGDGMSALHWAAMEGQPEMIDVLLYAGASTEATTRLGAYTPLHLAARAGHAAALEQLLDGGARSMARTSTGVASLHLAAGAGRPDAVRVLLEHGAEVDARTTKDQQTPLMWATAYDRVDVMRVLLEAGSDVSLTSAVVDYVAISERDRPARQRRQALVTAQRRMNEPVEEPAAEAPEEVAAEEATEEEAPEEQAAEEGQPPEAEGAPNEEEPPAEESPAEEAPEGEEAVAEQPTEEEAGEPAATEAEEPADEEATAVAEEEAQEPNEEEAEDEGQSQEEEAPEEPQAERDEFRPLSYNDLVGKEGGFAALHFAARDGHVEAAHLLLSHGADIDQVTAGDMTSPLLMATINGNFDLAMDFLEAGADPNLVAEDGAAPLFTALNRRWGPKAAYPQPSAFKQQRTDYLELLTALIDAGADVNHRTERHIWYTSFNFDMLGVSFAGATAFWRAAYATDVEAMKLLVAAGADPSIPTQKVPQRRFRRPGQDDEDKSGLPEVPVGGPAVYPIHAASGVGYGEGFAANSHSHAPDSWVDAVRYLVEEHGADVNARDLNGYSAVHHAAARGDNELIEYLVAQGADVMVVSRRGETTVDMANGPRQRVQPFPETIALLEGLGAINNHNCQSC